MYNAVMIKNKSLKKVYLGVNDAKRSLESILSSVSVIRSDLRAYGTNNFNVKIVGTYATRELAQDAVYNILATKYEAEQVYNDHEAAVRYINNKSNSREVKIRRVVNGSRLPIPVIDITDGKEYPSMNQASIKTGVKLNQIQKSIIEPNGRFRMAMKESIKTVDQNKTSIELTQEEAKAVLAALEILKDKMEA